MIILIIYGISILFSLMAFISFLKDIIIFMKEEKVYIPSNGNKLKSYLALSVFIFIALIPIINIIISSILAFNKDFFNCVVEDIEWKKIDESKSEE